MWIICENNNINVRIQALSLNYHDVSFQEFESLILLPILLTTIDWTFMITIAMGIITNHILFVWISLLIWFCVLILYLRWIVKKLLPICICSYHRGVVLRFRAVVWQLSQVTINSIPNIGFSVLPLSLHFIPHSDLWLSDLLLMWCDYCLF